MVAIMYVHGVKGNMSMQVDARRERLDSFFQSYRDAAMQKAAMKALRFLAADDEPMGGEPEG